MGAWGTGNFENDDALDFISEVEQKGKAAILEAIEKIALSSADKYIEAPDCCEALAAMEYVASAKGSSAKDTSEEVEDWIEEHEILPFKTGGIFGIGAKTIDITNLCVVAIKKIKINSELKELWEESEEYNEWLQVLENLTERIS